MEVSMRNRLLLVLTVVLGILLTGTVFAQVPSALPPYQVYAGVGQLATATSGNAIAYQTDFQTNFHVGFRYFPTPKFALDATYIHDNVRVGKWLIEHNFGQLIQGPVQGYEYSALGIYAEYWPIRTLTGGVFVFAGPQGFFGTGNQPSTMGVAAGVGAQYVLGGRFFLESKVTYWHVQNFLLPVANVYGASLSIGYQF
jgi:hypothetical protein